MSTSTVFRIETGRSRPQPGNVRALLDLYRVTGSERDGLIQLAREARQPGWWHSCGFIRQARESGRIWYEIGQALDLLWRAVASKESVADEAYDYALRYERITVAKPAYTWTCQSCEQIITDHGPWPLQPEQQEEGHAADCPRWTDRRSLAPSQPCSAQSAGQVRRP